MTKPTVNGFTQARFDAVKEVFTGNLQSGADIGASFCATLEGETVVDIWAASRTKLARGRGRRT